MTTKQNRLPVLSAVSCAMPPDALETLGHLTAHVILLPPDPLLPPPVASHPDMLLFPMGDTLVTHSAYYRTARSEIDRILRLTGRELCLTDCPRGPVYPLDVALNGLLCGRYLFGRTDILAPEILRLAEENGITPVPVKQGYAGCSGLVTDGTLCTADPSLTKAAREREIPVISVPDADILLPGYDHGFFGGCGGVWGKHVFLCGTPDPVRYSDFLNHPVLRDKTVHRLYSGPLFDCGGIRLFSI